MGPIKLDPAIMKTMETWGGNYDSTVGCSDDTSDNKVDSKIAGKDVTINKMSQMDAPHPKSSSDNPGFDKGFWAKASPQKDTVGEGLLTRKLKD